MTEEDKQHLIRTYIRACRSDEATDRWSARDEISDASEFMDLTVAELLDTLGLDKDAYEATKPTPRAQAITG